MQPRRAVRVDDALGIARRAARVTHRRGTVLVVDVPLDRRRGGQQVLVLQQLGSGAGLGELALRPSSITTMCLTVSNVSTNGHSDTEQRLVDEDHLVLGVVDDVRQLIGEEPDVQRVQHATATGRGEVELEVTCRVPRKRGDASARGDTEGVEHAAQPPGSRRPIAVGEHDPVRSRSPSPPPSWGTVARHDRRDAAARAADPA